MLDSLVMDTLFLSALLQAITYGHTHTYSASIIFMYTMYLLFIKKTNIYILYSNGSVLSKTFFLHFDDRISFKCSIQQNKIDTDPNQILLAVHPRHVLEYLVVVYFKYVYVSLSILCRKTHRAL